MEAYDLNQRMKETYSLWLKRYDLYMKKLDENNFSAATIHLRQLSELGTIFLVLKNISETKESS